MPRTVHPHPYLNCAAWVAAVTIAAFWLWRTLLVVAEHIRGDTGP
ncbi:MAG TPA: hypothetical protein VK477_08385 [Acidobacteriota bacterium]|nr:hypothetical protein [Acidobacteriota bacterium]